MKTLTVGELQKIIQDLPDDAEVVIDTVNSSIDIDETIIITDAIGKVYGYVPTTENFIEGVWTLELKLEKFKEG